MTDAAFLKRTALTAALACAAQIWGAIGWLLALWAACFTLDYITGSLAAFRNHEWDSGVAREGLWHKGAMILVVLVAALFDLAILTITRSAGIILPFHGVFTLPIVLSWYIITELGSILENAVKMGAEHVPAFLAKGLKLASKTVEQAGDKKAGGGDGQG